ncbi:hypothetical protein ARMSODRAFT_1025038 [Armillaria solidipes]|uniref:Uncharacterized protein n=1 Tax=Armillaria solidipes TaxID=1076256 RepID=A0A2H3ATN6_9AGAR|nr:hypothetical protein ARMSODRAFT_1025038 [Armillaria solidipes]
MPTMHVPSPDLSQDEKSALFGELDTYLNALILESWFHGLYTGIVVATLWTILTATKRLHGPFLHTIIIMLYVLRTLAFVMEWTFERHAFIENGYNDYSVFAALMGNDLWWRVSYFIAGITGGISTILVDITIIWRCWMLWDCQWPVVLIPIMFLVAATGEHMFFPSDIPELSVPVMKAMQMFSDIRTVGNNISESVSFATEIDWPLIYIVLSLTTTLMCTLLIVYRIVRFAHRLLLFRRIISALIESAMIYTLTLTVYLALVGRQMTTAYYADIVATYARAIAPTLLALRVAAGSTSISSDDESNASGNISDIRFGPMGENSSSSNPSDESFSGSHGTGTAESV